MANDRLKHARTAEEVSAAFRQHPDNERLYRESQVRRTLSEFMRKMREASGISQIELAKRVGCKQPFIAKLESGAYERCGIATLRTFARAMKYDIDVPSMFRPIQQAAFSGTSSCGPIEAQLEVQDELTERLATVSLARWISTEAVLIGKESLSSTDAKPAVRKEASAAA